MAEYIKREDALKEVDHSLNLSEAYSKIAEMPAADVVPVVRCEDCSYSLEDGFWCMGCGLMPGHATLPGKWCDEGERYDSGARMDGGNDEH